MNVISESEQRTTTTPAGSMFGLAGPSQGSSEVSTWRVELGANAGTPVHIIDREQVWMLVSGEMAVELEGETGSVRAGQAIVVPAGAVRRLASVGGPAQALVAMPVGGKAMLPGGEERIPIPWAE
ncbi:Cupin domain-containing protein [Actinacidiphila yanglinensis]|uniref:Cupin domain-containing protein n=1 Tax=Actinacidiphila yanglinensis TaxID=310779 RepID=A0A1H6AVY3_9ACTN|nr:cupin domain-containing protein [Actinacidiphila yanglinensis]SEG52759.1 Cupin domain-containing protein [Actinacidiphila yanglinensis]